MIVAERTTALTIAEASELTRLETIIERGMQTFVEVGSALMAIRDQKLYRAQFPTFAEYIRARWSISPQRAYQLITAGLLSTQVDIQNERQGRELKRLPEDLRPLAWDMAKQLSTTVAPGKPVPARIVKAAVNVVGEAHTTGGYVDCGDGEMTPLDAALTQETHENTKRQQQHIRQSIERANGHDHDRPVEGDVLVISTDERRGFVTIQCPELARIVGQGEKLYAIFYIKEIV